MAKRTTIILQEDIYEKLVQESLRRYKTTKAISKVANEMLRASLGGEANILNLVFSKKISKTTAKEFEEFRRLLSKRFES